jgi:predicted aconitase with swiveling domain
VLNTAKGGVASAWMLHEMAARDIVPKAILFNQANTILVQGAALADIAMCDRFEDGDITQLVTTGQQLEIDPEAGIVRIIGD